jgi:hypothetical protein
VTSYSEACIDPNLFGPWFAGESWSTWRVLDKALFGEPLSPDELKIFTELTGRAEAPSAPAKEAWLIMGRRSGKDIKAASIAVFMATIGAELHGYRKRLQRGERGVVQILAVDRDQASVAFRYAKAFFEQPLLAPLLKRETADTLELTNDLAIEITTNDQRRVRGRTVVAAIFDEVAHWRSENTTSPDLEVYRAVRPAMLTMPNALLIGISSPYASRGLLWEKFNKNYGQDGDVLVAKAPTWKMNLTTSRDTGDIADTYKEDFAFANAEYGAEFRNDLEAFISQQVLDAVIDPDFERPHHPSFGYNCFVDPSGGSNDAMTMCVAHMEHDIAVLDVIREIKAPFNPIEAVAEFCATMKQYGITRCNGDRYGAEWITSAFDQHGVFYEPAGQSRSELYLNFLPMANSGTVALLSNDRMRRQFLSLERRTGRARDTVDHPKGMHDDIANSVAGALVLCKLEPGVTALPGWSKGQTINYRDKGWS